MTVKEAKSSSIVPEGLPAGFISRSEAFILDIVFLAISSVVATWLFDLLYNFFALNVFLPDLERIQIAPIITLILVPFYYLYFWAFIGSTPGKFLLGLKIVRKDGADLSFGRSIVRFVGYWISAIPLFLGFFWVLLDRDRQGWHDKLANTKVIYTHNRTSRLQKKKII